MTWEPLNLAALPDSEPPEPDLSGVGYRGGKRHLLIGPPESLKTWAAFAIGLDEIRRDGVVLHVDLEMSPVETRRRLTEMGATAEELAAWAYVDPERAPAEGELETLIGNHAPTLALIDASAGAFDLLDLDDNARRDAETFARRLIAPFHRAAVSTLTVDHVTKNADARGRWAIGSERKTGQADVVLGAKTLAPFSRGHTGRLAINTLKDRFGAVPRPQAAELELVSDGSRITWTFKAASLTEDSEDVWKPTELMAKVKRYLEQRSEPVSRNQIVRDVTGKRTYLLEAIQHVIDEGSAQETQDGLIVCRFPVPERFPPVPGNQSVGGSPVPPLYEGNREPLTEPSTEPLEQAKGGATPAGNQGADTPPTSLGRISTERGGGQRGSPDVATPALSREKYSSSPRCRGD